MIYYDIILDILEDPASYCLRERFARETDFIKHLLSQEFESIDYYFGLKLLSVL
jgi:hypothetical protein